MKSVINEILITFFASFFIWFLFAGLAYLWLVDGKIKKEQVMHAVFAASISWIAAMIIKIIFPVSRPFVVNGLNTGVVITPLTPSFPSEHTVIAFAIAVTIFLHDKRFGLIFLVSSLTVGIARVLANVHYPTDIVGGAFLGTIVAVIVEKTHFMKIFGKTSTKNNKKRH